MTRLKETFIQITGNNFYFFIFRLFLKVHFNFIIFLFFDKRLCVTSCAKTVCNGQAFTKNQGILDKLTNWQCFDQCRYDCMWRTVSLFHRNYRKTPQFHGKWPFIRFFGMQEPAAAIFSMFNLIAHVQLLRRFLKKIHPEAPMRNVWILYGLVSINAWICSTIFHSRDVTITEKVGKKYV